MSLNPNAKLESAHDLSRGERSYLREQGITPAQFDKMDSTSQKEWKDECKNPAYETMRRFKPQR